MDGLKSEIRSAVVIQRPPDLDTACVLALLQEEVLDRDKKRDFRRIDSSSSTRHHAPSPLPLPLPPRGDKPQLQQSVEPGHSKHLDEKMAALRAYRRARGLCIKCAEKWSRDHKCPESVQLQVMQELYDLFQLEEECTDEMVEPQQQSPSEQLFMSLSEAAVSGLEVPKMMKFQGQIQGKQVLILVDSGSSHTFVNTEVAAELQGISALVNPVGVQVADGSHMLCSSQIPKAEWSIQGCSFQSGIKILPLSHYDMILGMDWLERYSPMQIHWKHKWISISYQESTVLLQGIIPELPAGSMVEVSAVLVTDAAADKLNVPPELAQLLEDFSAVFEPPSGLPPERACDHNIPLVEGASPVVVRTYRYPPAVKDEIEK